MPIGDLFGGGGDSGSDAHITHTQTNPVVPEDMGPLAGLMNAIATALQGSPVNFGPIKGLDAPATSKPQGLSLGSLMSMPAFNMGANRMTALGRPMARPRSRSISNRARFPISNTGRMSYGDMFTKTPAQPVPSPTPTPMPIKYGGPVYDTPILNA